MKQVSFRVNKGANTSGANTSGANKNGAKTSAKRLAKPLLVTAMALSISACSLLPGSQGEQRSGPQANSPQTGGQQALRDLSGEQRQCLAQLQRAGARFSPLPDRDYGSGCATVNTVELSALSGDRSSFSVSSLGPVACPLASNFAGWARFGVDRAARQKLGSGLARIETFGSYSCRNVAGSSRRSAHSRAEAIDVAAFVLEDGRRISLKRDWDGGNQQTREFLRIVQASACKRFGTVLGPDYNAAHEDHFHLELSGGSFCR